ncbi:MAG: hypothetical protein ACR2NC_01405, partial [Thermodesulfobacteriota bacterium]
RVDNKKLNRRTFESLIKSGAFDSVESNRAKLINSIENILAYTAIKQRSSIEGQHSLFEIDSTIPAPSFSDFEDWDEKTLLTNEMEVLGFYVTSHPMSKYSSELEIYTSRCDSETIAGQKTKKGIKIAGVVRSLEVKHTKSGSNIYGNMVLEDLKGSVDVIIFNDTLRKSMDILDEKVEPIVVEGFIDPSEERAKIRASEIYSLSQLRNSSSLHVDLGESNANSDMMNKLKDIFVLHPGESTIYLHLNHNGEESVIEVGNCKVDVHEGLITKVEGLLGASVVRLS